MLPQRVTGKKDAVVKKEHIVFDLDSTLLDTCSDRDDFFCEALVALFKINQHRIDRVFCATHRCRDSMVDFYNTQIKERFLYINTINKTDRKPDNYKTSRAISNLKKLTQKEVTPITGDDYADLVGTNPLPLSEVRGFRRLSQFEEKEFDPKVYEVDPNYQDNPLLDAALGDKDWQYLAIAFDILGKAVELNQQPTKNQTHVLHIFEDVEEICFIALELANSRFWPKNVEMQMYHVDSSKKIFHLTLNSGKVTATEIPIDEIIKQLPQTELQLKMQLERIKNLQMDMQKLASEKARAKPVSASKSDEALRQERFNEMNEPSYKNSRDDKRRQYYKARQSSPTLMHYRKTQLDRKKEYFSLWHKNSKLIRQERENKESSLTQKVGEWINKYLLTYY